MVSDHVSRPQVPTRANLSARTPVGQFLTRARIDAALTLEQVSERTGIQVSALSMYERRASISFENYERLRALFRDLPPAWAFTYPAIVHNYTGQKCRPPADMPYGEVEAMRARVRSQVLVPEED